MRHQRPNVQGSKGTPPTRVIRSLELAGNGVRDCMVEPDAASEIVQAFEIEVEPGTVGSSIP